MTIDDAIKNHIVQSERALHDIEYYTTQNDMEWLDDCKKEYEQFAEEERQLVELLRELKKYRVAHYKLRDMDYEYDLNSKFGDNPMYYGEKVWDIFGDIDEHHDEVMGYEEVNVDE